MSSLKNPSPAGRSYSPLATERVLMKRLHGVYGLADSMNPVTVSNKSNPIVTETIKKERGTKQHSKKVKRKLEETERLDSTELTLL